jgi:SH3 domain-containing protein
MTAHRHYKAWWLAAGLALLAGPALADTGDLFQVSGERANLRSGPSDQTTVRNQLLQGEQLVELRRAGNWVGVRVMRTGEEGWIYADLVARVQQSQLTDGAPVGIEEAGFQALAPEFDQLMGRLDQQLGYRMVATVQVSEAELRVTPTREFLIGGGREAHIATTLAIYQMWKNHQNGRPVAVTLLDDRGNPYIGIQDRPSGPELIVPMSNLASR